MASSRFRTRITILCEDRRQERFFRGLLEALGYPDPYIQMAPAGSGSGETWVRLQYPRAVSKYRRSAHHQNVGLLGVRDGDNQGVAVRKRELDSELAQKGLPPRQPDEHIATPVPTWHIETWLRWFQGVTPVIETKSYKQEFEHSGGNERQLGRQAAELLYRQAPQFAELPSLRDARSELARLESS